MPTEAYAEATEAKATEATEAYARRVPHVTLERLYMLTLIS
jgi:hypothetical protein